MVFKLAKLASDPYDNEALRGRDAKVWRIVVVDKARTVVPAKLVGDPDGVVQF